VQSLQLVPTNFLENATFGKDIDPKPVVAVLQKSHRHRPRAKTQAARMTDPFSKCNNTESVSSRNDSKHPSIATAHGHHQVVPEAVAFCARSYQSCSDHTLQTLFARVFSFFCHSPMLMAHGLVDNGMDSSSSFASCCLHHCRNVKVNHFQSFHSSRLNGQNTLAETSLSQLGSHAISPPAIATSTSRATATSFCSCTHSGIKSLHFWNRRTLVCTFIFTSRMTTIHPR
jgi:hypothetical protein